MAGEIEKLMQQFAAHWHLAEPEPDERGRYSFVMDSRFEVVLFQAANFIYLQGNPGALPDDPRQAEPLLGVILRRQLALMRDNPEALSMDPESNELTLFRRLPARGLSLADLEKAVGTFVNQLEFWIRELSGVQPQPAQMLPMHIIFP